MHAENAGKTVGDEDGVRVRVPVPYAAARALDGNAEALFVVFQLRTRGFEPSHLGEDQGTQPEGDEDRGDEHQPVEGDGPVPGILVDPHGTERVDAQLGPGDRRHREGHAFLAKARVGGCATAVIGQPVDETVVETEAGRQRGARLDAAHLRPDGQHAAGAVGEGDHPVVAPVRQNPVGAQSSDEGADRTVRQLHRYGENQMGGFVPDDFRCQAGRRIKRLAGNLAKPVARTGGCDRAAVGQKNGNILDDIRLADGTEPRPRGGHDIVDRRVAEVGAGKGQRVPRLGDPRGDPFRKIARGIRLRTFRFGDQGFAFLLDLHQEDAAIGEGEEQHGQHDPHRARAAPR